MKSYIFTAIIILSVARQKCGKDAVNTIPSCVQAKIDEIKKQPKWNPPASVEEYNYNGRRVFLFSANCCDQYNQAFDESCNYVCAPSGGITGKGDRKCEDFRDKARLIRVVWKDER
jgi:hypothetical protein